MHPIWPNEENLMGTDDAGRDIYARLVYGTRNTLRLGFYIAFFRLLLALPAGLLAGAGKRFFKGLIQFYNTWFSAVPILILSFLIFRMKYFRNMQMDRAILVYALIIALLGWSRMAGALADSVRNILQEDFVEGEIAIGKTWFQILRQNVLPHLLPSAISLFFKEMGQGLFLLAQLAVLGIFVGTVREVRTLAFRANYEMSIEPEWGSMMLKITTDLGRFESMWWLTVFPVLIFTLAVMGMNLLGEGLRLEFSKRNSRFVSQIRKAYYVLSPRVFLMELWNFRSHWKSILLKTGTVGLLLAVFLVPRYQPLVRFDVENAKVHLTELSSEKYGGRVSGTEGAWLAGEYIIDTMEASGFQTLEFPIQYLYEYQEEQEYDKAMALSEYTPLVMMEGRILLLDELGQEEEYLLHEDFSILEVPMEGAVPGDERKIRGRTILEDSMDLQGDQGELIPIIHTGINERAAQGYAYNGFIEESAPVEFLLVSGHESRSNGHSSHKLTVVPFGKLKERLEKKSYDVVIEYTVPEYPVHDGRIIESWLIPEGKTLEEPGETLIIGVPYDGLRLKNGGGSVEATTSLAMALEMARAITEGGVSYEKSILFLFFDDETELLLQKSEHYYQRHVEVSTFGGYTYLELMGSGLKDTKDVDLVAYFGQVDKENSFRSLLEMESILKKMKVPYTRYQGLLPTEEVLESTGIYEIVSRELLNFRANAHLSVGIGKAYQNQKGTKMDTLENLNEKKMESMGQMLVDLMVSKKYFRLGEK